MTGEYDPAWHDIQRSAEEEDAWRELEAQRDRENDHTPAPTKPAAPAGPGLRGELTGR